MSMRTGMKIRPRLAAAQRVKVACRMRVEHKEHLEQHYDGVTAGVDELLRRAKFETIRPTRKPPGRLNLVMVTIVITQEQRDAMRASGGITGCVDELIAEDIIRVKRREKRQARPPRPRVPRPAGSPPGKRGRPRKVKPVSFFTKPEADAPTPPASVADPRRSLSYLEALPVEPCAECGRWPDHWSHHSTSDDDRNHVYRAEA
jgi:hypothetical protein